MSLPRSVLLIDERIRGRIKSVVKFAHANPVTRERLLATVQGRAPAIGEDLRYRLEIPIGFRCVYSEEDQPDGLMRHLSVSVDRVGRAPSPEAMGVLMLEFGFTKKFAAAISHMSTATAVEIARETKGTFWVEKVDHAAINVLELIV
jgi:hypothetical protein